MDVVFLSHCVPNPPDKGEKIRAYHEVTCLARRHRVHLVCFAKQAPEVARARELLDRCASVYVELRPPRWALARAAAGFVVGRCLTTSFYGSSRMRRHVRALRGLDAAVVYSAAMAQYAPPHIPMLLDMVDVDSEKWFQYGDTRRPGWAYRIEGARLRRAEREAAGRSACTLFSTEAEKRLFQTIMPGAEVECLENGVDFDYFARCGPAGAVPLENRRFLVFAGAMDYYPNVDAARWFADCVFPALRMLDSGLEFVIVGRNPAASVRRLGRRPGITVTGTVPDVRPYLLACRAAVAPLRIARGIQNKVMEALAMGKPVYASDAVCRTFGGDLPPGVLRCRSAEDFVEAIVSERGNRITGQEIVSAARRRFAWEKNLAALLRELDMLAVERSGLCPARSS